MEALSETPSSTPAAAVFHSPPTPGRIAVYAQQVINLIRVETPNIVFGVTAILIIGTQLKAISWGYTTDLVNLISSLILFGVGYLRSQCDILPYQNELVPNQFNLNLNVPLEQISHYQDFKTFEEARRNCNQFCSFFDQFLSQHEKTNHYMINHLRFRFSVHRRIESSLNIEDFEERVKKYSSGESYVKDRKIFLTRQIEDFFKQIEEELNFLFEVQKRAV
jgi:hypothetical protein